jgi:hypothetical protein
MSERKTRNGPGIGAVTSDVEQVVDVIRRVADDGDRVTLSQLARESGLTAVEVENAMGSIERVAPVSAKRLSEPGRGVAWRVSV